MMNASAAARVQAQNQSLAAFNEPQTGVKADKKTVGTFLMGFIAAWALLPAEGKDVPKPKVTL